MTKNIVIVAVLLVVLAGCSGKKVKTEAGGETHIAVFIPGVVSGSPTYELLVEGVQKAAEEAESVKVTVIEAGYNQAEWEAKLSAIAASGQYRLIISSNPSMPDIAASVAAKFPATRYMILDGEYEGNPAIYTLNYDKKNQAYALGYLAALITGEAGGKGAIGLISAQHYPIMDNAIAPSYLEGAAAALPGAALDFRIVGSWSDTGKALELADDMIAGGVKVILTIAGAGNEGVVQAAAERGAKALWFDTNAYDIKPGVIAGCCKTFQDKAAYVKLKQFLAGDLPFGSSETVGFREGYVDFVDDDPLYESAVSSEVRNRQAEMLQKLRNGSIILNTAF